MRYKRYSKKVCSYAAKSIIIIILIFCLSNTVQAKYLKIDMNDTVVNEDEEFSVKVYSNESSDGIQGVTVYIQSTSMPPATTNRNGIAFLKAPSNSGNFLIVAEKTDYSRGELEIKVVTSPAFWEHPYFLIVIAIVCLVGAIIFVNIKQKKDIYNRAKEITHQKLLKKHDKKKDEKNNKNVSFEKEKPVFNEKVKEKTYTPEPVRSKPSDDAKIEEIRISRPKIKKEVVSVDDKKGPDKVVLEKKIKKRDYDWFEGKKDVRYEIDKITGEIDEKGKDKWFEGVDTVKLKIDEKVKKKDKKKKDDKEE